MPDDEGRQDAPHGASPAPDGSPPADRPEQSPWSSPADAGPPAEPPAPPSSGPPGSLPPDAGAESPYGAPPPPPSPYGAPPPPPHGPPPAQPYGSASYGPPPGSPGGPGYGAAPYGAQPGYGGQPGYGAAGYGYGGPRTSNNATLVLVCGIASLLVPCIGLVPAIVALVRAGSARREILASNGQLTGLGMVTAGRITAWIGVVLTLLAIALIVLAVLFSVPVNNNFGDDGFSASAG